MMIVSCNDEDKEKYLKGTVTVENNTIHQETMV